MGGEFGLVPRAESAFRAVTAQAGTDFLGQSDFVFSHQALDLRPAGEADDIGAVILEQGNHEFTRHPKVQGEFGDRVGVVCGDDFNRITEILNGYDSFEVSE